MLPVTTLIFACGAQVTASGGGTQGTDGGSTFGPGGRDAGGADAQDAIESGLPPPDAFVNLAVGGGTACATYPSLEEWALIGTAAPGHPNTVQSAGPYANNSVSVVCVVHPQGNGFDVYANAHGPQGDGMWFVSPKGQGIVTTMTSPGISAYFVNQSGAFTEDVNPSDPMGCTITYEYDPGGSPGGVAGDVPVPASPPIAAGRIWGHIKCPHAFDNATPSVLCDVEADFMFENCTQ
jgi:hypothetical protein